MSVVAIVAIVVAILMVLFVISIYNNLVAFKNRYLNAFSQIEVQLKRRYDLIPNLIETAKGYLTHEKGTLEEVTRARNAASESLKNLQSNLTNPEAIKTFNQAEQALNGAMGKFNLVVEAYPDLKASENMIRLHEEITTTENKVAFARQAYNDSVMSYNTYRQSFPQNLIANTFGHSKDAELLEFADSEQIQSAPKVKF